MRLRGFVAYPSNPLAVGAAVRPAVESLRRDTSSPELITWEENDIAGRFIVEPILKQIDECDLLVADITSLNFNVVFEVGYAIGRRKRVILIRNSSLTGSEDLIRQIGIFDTLGYQSYSNSVELVAILQRITDREPIPFSSVEVNSAAPVELTPLFDPLIVGQPS